MRIDQGERGSHDEARGHGLRRGVVHLPLDKGHRVAGASSWADCEVGEGSGALVVTTPARLHGAAIEIRVDGAPWTGAHATVQERRVGGLVHFAGVFPRLDAGQYELRILGASSGVVVPIAIDDGTVVETWLDAPVD